MLDREKWEGFYDRLSRRDRAEAELIFFARCQRRNALLRLRRFFVLVEEKMPPLIIGCRRALNFFPHPTRRATDNRPALFEIAPSQSMIAGCAVLAVLCMRAVVRFGEGFRTA